MPRRAALRGRGGVEGVQGVEPAGALRVVGFGCHCVRCKGGVHALLGRLVVFALTELRAGDGQRVGGRARVFGNVGCVKAAAPGDAVQLIVVRVGQKVFDASDSPRGRCTGA
jgi:hypothetical protein